MTFIISYLSYLKNEKLIKEKLKEKNNIFIGNSVGEYSALSIGGIIDPI